MMPCVRAAQDETVLFLGTSDVDDRTIDGSGSTCTGMRSCTGQFFAPSCSSNLKPGMCNDRTNRDHVSFARNWLASKTGHQIR
jgi:hypothetical protein